MSLHRISTEAGIRICPTQKADDMIFGHLWKMAMPEGIEDNAFWIADKVVDHGFEAGWFYDELADDKIDELVRYAKSEAEVNIADNPQYSEFFRIIAQRAILTGSHAYTMAQLDNVTIKG